MGESCGKLRIFYRPENVASMRGASVKAKNVHGRKRVGKKQPRLQRVYGIEEVKGALRDWCKERDSHEATARLPVT